MGELRPELTPVFMEIVNVYKAPAYAGKKYTRNPCALCGWSKNQEIHKNPHLIGLGGPYHDYRTDNGETK